MWLTRFKEQWQHLPYRWRGEQQPQGSFDRAHFSCILLSKVGEHKMRVQMPYFLVDGIGSSCKITVASQQSTILESLFQRGPPHLPSQRWAVNLRAKAVFLNFRKEGKLMGSTRTSLILRNKNWMKKMLQPTVLMQRTIWFKWATNEGFILLENFLDL